MAAKVNPFEELSTPHLKALLRVWNSPQFDAPEARPYLADLVAAKLIKNTEPRSSTPWWALTPKGKAMQKAFVFWHGPEKERFLSETYRMWEG